MGAAALQVIRGGVVAQVGGEEDVGAGLSRGHQQRVPNPTGDGHRLDGGVRVPADEEAGRGVGQGGGNGGGEIAQPGGVLELADPADALGGVEAARAQWPRAEQADAGGERVGHSPVRGVEAGVGVGQRDTGADEPVDAAALGVGGVDVKF